MYAIIKDDKVISTCSFEPCPDDLASRGEYSVRCQSEMPIGYTYTGYSADGTNFSPPEPIVPTKESLLTSIRMQRDLLLSQSDKYMITDYPTGSLTREQWTKKVLTYRQVLRDFPNTCDVNNPVYPVL